ncbi:MAG: hypothetical protein SPF70_01465 [Lachnospiraceae bacterium]|nr:hypothetical protein [Lachnospiraceae bacterium]
MAKHKITPFEQWETTKVDGVEKRYFRMGATLMASEQMRSLSPSAFKIYCYMRLESGGSRSFKFPHAKYRSYMSKPTFLKAKQELIDKGFIDVVQNNKNLRKSNIYAFSDRWKSL